MKIALSIALLFCLVGCDQKQEWEPQIHRNVKLYQNGQVIRSWRTSGNVKDHFDFYTFDTDDGHEVVVTNHEGTLVIED